MLRFGLEITLDIGFLGLLGLVVVGVAGWCMLHHGLVVVGVCG